MRHMPFFLVFACSIMMIPPGYMEKDDFPVLKGPYLGQKPPEMNPEIFAPGIISTENLGEAGSAFTKNGDMFLFNRRTPPEEHKTIYTLLFVKGTGPGRDQKISGMNSEIQALTALLLITNSFFIPAAEPEKTTFTGWMQKLSKILNQKN